MPNLSNQAASSAVNGLAAQLNAGFIDIYSSTQPANGNTNTSAANVLLAEFTFSTVAGSVASSTFTAATIAATTAVSTGTATFYRAYSSSRIALLDGSVSTAAAEMNFNSIAFASGVSAQITSYTLVLPEQ